MAINDYRFVDKWRVKGTVAKVYEILSNGADLPRWWPGIYLEANQVQPNDENGVGGIVHFRAQGGRLLYVLNWTARTTESRKPFGFSIEASGDFVGTGVWTFAQDGDWVDITYEWTIRAEAPILRFLSPVIKPILAENHRYAMWVGERGLQLELARRHAQTPEDLASIPAPPGPVTVASVLPALGVIVGSALAVGIVLRALLSGSKQDR